MLPIRQYHDRWKELWKDDFLLFLPDGNYFLKGYYLTSVSIPATVDQNWMNEVAHIESAADGWTEEIENGEINKTSDGIRAYVPKIKEEQRAWLLQIKALCEENGAEMRLIKAPSR